MPIEESPALVVDLPAWSMDAVAHSHEVRMKDRSCYLQADRVLLLEEAVLDEG
jgi:hypothetical protein